MRLSAATFTPRCGPPAGTRVARPPFSASSAPRSTAKSAATTSSLPTPALTSGRRNRRALPTTRHSFDRTVAAGEFENVQLEYDHRTTPQHTPRLTVPALYNSTGRWPFLPGSSSRVSFPFSLGPHDDRP